MTTILGLFTTQVCDFSDQLLVLYPNDEWFNKFSTSVYLLKKTNPKQILELFTQYIYPHKDNIIDNNDDFFLTNTTEYDTIDTFMVIVTSLKKYWHDISTINKECIWKYFKIFIILKEKYDIEKL